MNNNIQSLSALQYFTIFAAIVLVVLLYFAPNKPPLKEKFSVANESSEEPLEEKIDRAVDYVQSGKEPMKGIMLLREILAEDSNHIEANFYLGVFAVQSNQWEKAKLRFEKVLLLDSTHSESYLYLARVCENSGDTAMASELAKKGKQMQELQQPKQQK